VTSLPPLSQSRQLPQRDPQSRGLPNDIEVNKQAIMLGYNTHVWYNKKAITNIFALRNAIKHYQVTYNSNDQMFVVHHDLGGKPTWNYGCTKQTTLFQPKRQQVYL
jgi:hypothetical protein